MFGVLKSGGAVIYRFVRGIYAFLLSRVPRRAVPAFLCLLIVSGVIMPPVSAYAAEKSAARAEAGMSAEQNYPGAMPTAKSSAAASADAGVSGLPQKSTYSITPQQLSSQPKINPHELTDKRTATTSTSVNADGTLTKKQFFSSRFYQKDGKWQDIDTSLEEDKNAGDSGNIAGKALGQVQSWFSSATNFQVKSNSWQARFSPSDSDKGMVRIRQNGSQIGFVPVNAKKVAPVITTNRDGEQVVHYYDLWPGVNVEYIVKPDSLKENIILKDKNAANRLSFKVLDAKLEAKKSDQTAQGEFAIKGALNNDFSVAPPNLILNSFGQATKPGILSQQYKDGQITLSVNEDYLKNLPNKAFPAVIDPQVKDSRFGSRAGGNYLSFKTDGYICYSDVCNPYAGTLYDSDGWMQYWRSAIFAPYNIGDPGTKLTNATLHLTQRSNESFWTGDWDTHNYQAGHAYCLSNFNCVDGIWGSASFGSSGNIDLTALYQSRIAANDYGAWVMLMGEDNTDHSFKNFDPDSSYVSFTFGGPPSAPSVASPVNSQVYTDPQPSFKLTPLSNPNGGTPLKYEVLVSSGPSATGGLITSNFMDATQWTIPDGILQDGSTYYVQARSYDPITGSYSGWGASVPFRIDMRTGKDNTQSYDTLGPVNVDLATGNLSTSASSHTTAALGGDLGISLDYNTPLKSRNGLVGKYWNVPANYPGGRPTTEPTVTRVDQNVDFNWDLGSPSGGVINNDWTYAQWSGYFVAPVSGDYYFGGNNDDGMAVGINGQEIYANGGCYSGVCYGSPTHLTAGQAVPITVDYAEVTGPSYAHLYVKGPVSEQIVPSAWLQTGVRPVSDQHGLTGSYYGKYDGTNTFSSGNPLLMKRTDSYLNFDWGTGSPMPNGPDGFLVRWSGYITAPVTGTYNFGVISDDGAKIMLGANNTVVYNEWVDRGATEAYGSGYLLTANTPTPVTIEYYDAGGPANFKFAVQGAVPKQVVPSDWLSPKAQVLPDGWNLGIDPDGSLNYDHITVNQNSAVLTDSTGSTHEYAWTGSAYKPPVNEDGQLSRNDDGSYTLQDTDGRTYVFNVDGTLKSVTNPVDDRKPAALQYTYASINGGAAALAQITDPLNSGKWAKVYYSGDSNCTASPSGFDSAAPTGMLCTMKTNDGRTTSFFYKDKQLARITRPGNEMTDYQYETLSNNGQASGYRLAAIRDSLANDAVAAGVRSNDDAVNTQITYDVLGRVTGVKQPAATAGAERLLHTIEYLPGALDKSYSGATQQHIGTVTSGGAYTSSSEPNGYSRRIEYDALYRTNKDTDIAGMSTTSTWNMQKDLLYTTTDPTGLTSTTIYDDQDRPTASYGPAPSSWFASSLNPTTNQTDVTPISTYQSQVPKTTTSYDQGMAGTQVAWYNAKGNSLYGSPKLHTTGLYSNDPTRMGHVFSETPAPITPDPGMDGYGLTATAKLRFPQNGTYTFKLWHDDGLRLYIDDQLQIDDWTLRTEGTNSNYRTFTLNATANKVYRFRIDYIHTGTPGFFETWTSGPGIPDQSGIGLGANHIEFSSADYGLTTSTTVYDTDQSNPNQTTATTTTTNYGSNPELGLAQSVTENKTASSGNGTGNDQNLTTSFTYEQQGATGSYNRQTAKYLPGADTANPNTATKYNYYTAAEAKDNPCVAGTDYMGQTGLLKGKTEPDPDNNPNTNDQPGVNAPRTTEVIYDRAGRTVASRYNQDPWTCTTYDARGRVAQNIVPDITVNGTVRSGRTVTNSYAVGGNPLVTSQTDSVVGTATVTRDLLGRTTISIDPFGYQATTTYDSLGRVSQQTSLLGTETPTYDNLNRTTSYVLDGTTYATIAYDQYSRVSSIQYPQATDGNGNNLKLEQVTRDSRQRSTGAVYRFSNNTTYQESLTLSTTGKVLSSTDNLNGTQAVSTYTYDKANRLTQATIDNMRYDYVYTNPTTQQCSQTSANLNSAENSNRTTYTTTNTQTNQTTNTTYCYNNADQLTYSSDVQVGTPTYDDHGNTIGLAGSGTPLTFTYDAGDQNTAIQQGTNKVEYTKNSNGSVLTKKEYRNNTLDKIYRNAANGSVLQTCSLTDENNCTTTDKYLSLPGGVTLTLSPNNQDQTKQKIYSLKNFHGDTALTVNAQGIATSSVHIYDPYGQVLASATFNTNAATISNSTDNPMGWASSPSRKAESSELFSIPVIQMGARVYLPTLGRFIQVDPIEGGCANAYVYAGDPVGGSDYSGQWSISNFLEYLAKAISKVVSKSQSSRQDASQAATKNTSANKARSASTRASVVTQNRQSSAPAPTPGTDFVTKLNEGRLRSPVYNRNYVSENSWALIYKGGNSAVDWGKGGALAGGLVGCVVGALGTLEFGGIGCIPLAISWAKIGARGGAIAGGANGFNDSPSSGKFEWGPDQVIRLW